MKNNHYLHSICLSMYLTVLSNKTYFHCFDTHQLLSSGTTWNQFLFNSAEIVFTTDRYWFGNFV